MPMTPRERTLAVLARQRPDRLPREQKLTPPLAKAVPSRFGASDPAEYFQLEVRDVFFAPPTDLADFRPYYPEGMPRLWNPPGWEIGEWGVGVTSGSMHHFIHIEHPLKRLSRLEELERYPFPDLAAPARHAHLEAEVRGLHDRGLFAIGFMEWTIFEIAWHIRGMPELFADIAFNPPLAEYLLDRITERRCGQARRFAEAGVDLLKIGDDVGTQIAMLISPRMYRQWFKPRHAAVIAAARAVRPDLPVCYHSDGNCWEVIEDLIEIGVTVLNPVQPECLDVAKVKQRFGDRLMFWGGVGTQTTMPFASPDQVYRTIQQTIDVLGPTGYFPCPTHVLEPEVPWENILAYLRAVEEYRFA
jgi:uroporphyrinogen decarboxylase